MAVRVKAPVTAHVFLLQAGLVLLLRRFQTGYEDGKYSVVAGHLESGETVLQTAMREAEEEVGVRIREGDLRVVGVMQRKSNDERVDFFLTALAWEGDVRNAEPEKCDDLLWRALDDLPENTIPYVRRAIANYRDGRWFDVHGWEAAIRKGVAQQTHTAPQFEIRPASPADLEMWTVLRCRLWPAESPELLRREALATLEAPTDQACFLAFSPDGSLVGFLEVSLRTWAEGCRSSPVGYLEGWYVEDNWRRQGVGGGLVHSGEAWARERGCREMGSDTQTDNSVSWIAHTRLGYREVGRTVNFRKSLANG
jgi:8-oxo-dGTP pyrophosphatase MutT (NUDIX family)/GNAT superfamily N-acetyltransferase